MSNVSEWRSSGAYSKYPFSESSTTTSSDGWKIPDGLFVDAQIRIPFDYEIPRISMLVKSSGGIMGVVMSGSKEIGTFKFAEADMTDGLASIVDSNGFVRGFLVSGPYGLQEVKKIPTKSVTFSSSSALFETSCVFKYPEEVVNTLTVDGSSVSGDVVLVEGPGIQLTKEGDSVIRIDAIGDSLSVNDISDCSRVTDGLPLKTINSIRPNHLGVIGIEPASYENPDSENDLRQVLKITASGNTITFSLAR